MATIINNPDREPREPREDGTGTGIVIGVIIAVLLVVFFAYFLPLWQSGGRNTPSAPNTGGSGASSSATTSSSINVNVTGTIPSAPSGTASSTR